MVANCRLGCDSDIIKHNNLIPLDNSEDNAEDLFWYTTCKNEFSRGSVVKAGKCMY